MYLGLIKVVINRMLGGKNYENSKPRAYCGWALRALLFVSEHGCTSLLQSKHPDNFLALSLIQFRFLALYRPGLWDWGTVNGTETGISKHSNLLLQNLRKIDISSSLSCNPSTERLDSAFSSTW